MTKQGLLVVISAPSGTGKTTLVNALIARDDRLQASVSYTTRTKRPTEVNGKDYYFVNDKVFDAMADSDEFMEHAQNFGYAYGTARDKAQQILETGSDLILEIDWQGASQVRKNHPSTLSVFILPPSREALEERLSKRGQDDKGTIARRIRQACADISHHDEFNYVVVNDEFADALTNLTAILEAGRRGERAAIDFPKALLNELLDGQMKT
jgi:guanylate kinase